MKFLFLLISVFGVFGVFIAQVIALTGGPFNRTALLLRLGTFVVWLASLALITAELLEFTSCHVDCIWGMSRQSFMLEFAVISVSALAAWFSVKGVPLVTKHR